MRFTAVPRAWLPRLALIAPCLAPWQAAAAPQHVSLAAEAFVTRFYANYESEKRRWRRADVDAGFRAAIAADERAQAANHDEVVGLDGDPFDCAQDGPIQFTPLTSTVVRGDIFVTLRGCMDGTCDASVRVRVRPRAQGFVLWDVECGEKGGSWWSMRHELANLARDRAKRRR